MPGPRGAGGGEGGDPGLPQKPHTHSSAASPSVSPRRLSPRSQTRPLSVRSSRPPVGSSSGPGGSYQQGSWTAYSPTSVNRQPRETSVIEGARRRSSVCHPRSKVCGQRGRDSVALTQGPGQVHVPCENTSAPGFVITAPDDS